MSPSHHPPSHGSSAHDPSGRGSPVDGWHSLDGSVGRPPEDAGPPPSCPAHADAARLNGPRFQRNPAQVYRDMRRVHGPVAPVLLEGDLPAWLVIGYRELHYVTSNPDLFARDPRHWNAWDRVPPDWPLLPVIGYRPSVLCTEGAEHQRRYGVIEDVLHEIDQFELRARTERITDSVIDSFAGHGAAELMESFAHRIPALVMSALCGLPEAEAAGMTHDLLVMIDNGPDAVAGFARVRERVSWLLADRRDHPGDDVTTRLITHPAGLDESEIVEDLMVVMGFGLQSNANWIGNALRLLLTDPRFAVDLSGGRRSVGQALNEVLWEDTPLQIFTGRWATRTTQLGGQRIAAGDLIALGLAGANADPHVRPDSYEGPGDNHAYMSFGHGEHRCPYPAQEIAEVIARTAVEVLLDRLPDVRLAVPAGTLVWRPTVWNRGLTALPVEFSPV